MNKARADGEDNYGVYSGFKIDGHRCIVVLQVTLNGIYLGHPKTDVKEVVMVISGAQDASTELFAEPNY